MKEKSHKDPVCKMEIESSDSQWNSKYKGETYEFCSEECKSAFDHEPQKYVVKRVA